METKMRYSVLLLALILIGQAHAGGFRCGSRLVLEGDTVSRLQRACGEPDSTMKARAEVSEQGKTRRISVTQWVYRRGGTRDVIVSILDGKVIRIARG